MSEHGTVARPYAQAVFELARDGGTFAAWSDFLQLAAVMVSGPEVGRLHPGTEAKQGLASAGACRRQLA